MRGGKTWFAIEAKSFEIEIEKGKKLRGCIWERCKGVTSWIKFGDRSLQCLLVGVEVCGEGACEPGWTKLWGEEGRNYKLEFQSNKAGSFIRCSVRDS